MDQRDAVEKAELDEISQSLLTLLKKGEPDSTVRRLAEEATSQGTFRKNEVIRAIYKLREIGMIDIVDPDPPISAIIFLFSTRATWFWLLAAAVLLADLSVYVLPQSSPFNYVRYLLGSFLVLYLPGASLVELLFPKREDLSQLLRLALSIGMSLAIVPLVGLLLNYTPLGITLDAIMVSLNFLTVAFSFGAVLRKYQNHMSTFEGQASNRS